MSTAAATITPPRPATPPKAQVRQQYIELRTNVHRKLLNKLNLEALAQADRARAESEIRTLLSQLVAEEGTPISLTEREMLFGEIVDDVFGLGPLEPLLRDPSINDILVNTHKNVFVERAGVLERVPATFQDDRHLLRIIDRIVSSIGRRVDDSSPMVDARLADGSRVNAIIPPLAVDGPLLSIRRFPAERLKAEDLVTKMALTQPMLNFLAACVKGHLNCLISGGTGAGKTTDQRRHRRRQDDAAECAVVVHRRAGTDRHHRGCGGTSAAPGTRGAARNPSGQRRRQRRYQAAPTGRQRPAYASRPHRHR
jgi:pilus assembly protein CpaF